MPNDPSQPDNMTESVMSGVAKSFASGAGKMLSNALTLGGAHAFEEGRKKDQQTQAELMNTFKDRASRGETFEAEDYRAWQNAGGDPAVIGGLQRDALGINKSREESRQYLEQMHKGKILDDNQYAMWAMALHSNDPTATALAMEGIKSQYHLSAVNLQGQLRAEIEGKKEKAAAARVDSTNASREKVAGETISAANSRERKREKAAGERTDKLVKSRERVAKLGQRAKQLGLQQKTMKNISSAADVVGLATGDPTAMKKLLPTDAQEKLTPEQAQVAFASANTKLASTPGISLERMAADGAFMLNTTKSGDHFWSGTESNPSYGVGLPALIENAAKTGSGGVTPEIAADFRTAWQQGLKEKDPQKRAALLDAAISKIPDKDAQSQIYAQLQDMSESIDMNSGADETEYGTLDPDEESSGEE